MFRGYVVQLTTSTFYWHMNYSGSSEQINRSIDNLVNMGCFHRIKRLMFKSKNTADKS